MNIVRMRVVGGIGAVVALGVGVHEGFGASGLSVLAAVLALVSLAMLMETMPLNDSDPILMRRYRFNIMKPAASPIQVERDMIEVEAPSLDSANAIVRQKVDTGVWIIGPAVELT